MYLNFMISVYYVVRSQVARFGKRVHQLKIPDLLLNVSTITGNDLL